MGTRYDLHCLDCHDTCRCNAKWDPVRNNEIREIIQHADALAGLGNLDGLVELCGGVYAPLKWLAEHKGHRLRPISEYGDIDGQCQKEMKCSACGAHLKYCNRDVGHEGECSREATS